MSDLAASRRVEIPETGFDEAVRIAAEALTRGEIVAFPTDTVYGIAANATDEQAVLRLYATKGRPSSKPLPVLLADPADLARIASPVPEAARRLAERFWPGALTIVLPHGGSDVKLHPLVTAGLPTVGVRVPDHEIARAILRSVQFPVAVTSANLSGEIEAHDADEVLAALGERVQVVVDGGRCPGGVPSTVVSVAIEPPAILREGAIPEALIRATLA